MLCALAVLSARRSLSTSAGVLPRLFRGGPPTQKQRRVAATVREALIYTLSSGIVKDRGFDNGASVHVIDVQVARGCVLARALWEPLDERYDPQRVEAALERKSGILRAHVNSYLNQVCCCFSHHLPHHHLTLAKAVSTC
jgi:ribosome-binding factor A